MPNGREFVEGVSVCSDQDAVRRSGRCGDLDVVRSTRATGEAGVGEQTRVMASDLEVERDHVEGRRMALTMA